MAPHPNLDTPCPHVPQANTHPSQRNIDARCSLPQACPPPSSVPKASGQNFVFPHLPRHRDIHERCSLPQAYPPPQVGPQATVRPLFGPSPPPDSVPKALPKMVLPLGIPLPTAPNTTAGEDSLAASNCSSMGETDTLDPLLFLSSLVFILLLSRIAIGKVTAR